VATRQILLDTGSIAIGRFVCPPGDLRWSRENWIGPQHHVVFPARSVVIEQAGRRPIVANPNRVMLYDADRTYRRELLSPDGDIATYVALGPELVRQIVGAGEDEPPPRFARSSSWLASDALLGVSLLVSALEDGRVDALVVEETLLGLLAGVISDQPPSPHRQRRSPGSRAATRRDHHDLVHDTERLLSRRFAEPLSLTAIARIVGSSPYHLARVFRAVTGQSLHAYREQIRLRLALDRLTSPTPGASLAVLASELGFASHSHLDARFRRTFGRTPAAVRSAAARGVPARTARRESSTILQGRGRRPD
jgi:AraC family transcriptional regulator